MKPSILAGALGLSLLSPGAFAGDAASISTDGGAASPVDRQFAGRAAASNTFEVRSSRMALHKSHDPAVRDLARWMIDSHTAAERELRAAASYADYQGGAAPVETPETSAMLADLAGLDGVAFDKAYVADQVAGHALTEQQMSDYAAQGSYEPLLRYEAAILPDVREHLAHFRDLQGAMGRGSDAAM